MDPIAAIILLALVALPLAVLSGWLVGPGYGGLGSIVNRGDPGSWWRSAMPWPEGVQEDDELAWHVRGGQSATGAPTGDGTTAEADRDAFELAPARPQAHVGLRPPHGSLRPPR